MILSGNFRTGRNGRSHVQGFREILPDRQGGVQGLDENLKRSRNGGRDQKCPGEVGRNREGGRKKVERLLKAE